MNKHISALLFCAIVGGCSEPKLEVQEVTAPKLLSKLDSKQVFCLAKNIYFEARNEPVQGLVAVAQVTLNRVDSDKFPNTVCEVVYQAVKVDGQIVRDKCQFSWYCDGKPDYIRFSSEAWIRSMKIAEVVMRDEYPDVVRGSLFYHADYVNPYWSKEKRLITKVGRHIFYNYE